MTGCDQQQHNEIKDGTVKTGKQEGGVWELRRQTGWYEAPWSPWENRAPNGAFVFMIQERRAETRGLQSERSLQERYHAVRGTALQRRVPVCVALGLSGWYILIIPHMHTFTVQDAQFVISFSKVQRSNMPRPQRGISRKVTLHKVCSYSQWCHIVDFSWRVKSLMDFQGKQKEENHILKKKETEAEMVSAQLCTGLTAQ